MKNTHKKNFGYSYLPSEYCGMHEGIPTTPSITPINISIEARPQFPSRPKWTSQKHLSQRQKIQSRTTSDETGVNYNDRTSDCVALCIPGGDIHLPDEITVRGNSGVGTGGDTNPERAYMRVYTFVALLQEVATALPSGETVYWIGLPEINEQVMEAINVGMLAIDAAWVPPYVRLMKSLARSKNGRKNETQTTGDAR